MSIVIFGENSYLIATPLPSWEAGIDGWCAECDDRLTFVFAPRLNPQTAGFGGSYETPVAIRCKCFLDKSSSAGLDYHRKLVRELITIKQLPKDGDAK
jgi:hypothetical protein